MLGTLLGHVLETFRDRSVAAKPFATTDSIQNVAACSEITRWPILKHVTLLVTGLKRLKSH